MALPDFQGVVVGTAVVWGESGGSGVTDVLSLDALADGTAYMSAYADLSLSVGGITLLPSFVTVEFRVETGAAPTAGNTAECYLAWSDSTSKWPAGVSGSDGAWPADGNEDEWAMQLGNPAVILVATNDGNTEQIAPISRRNPRGRYVVAVVDNNLGQAFRDTTPNSDNLSRVIVAPYYFAMADALS